MRAQLSRFLADSAAYCAKRSSKRTAALEVLRNVVRGWLCNRGPLWSKEYISVEQY
jgi:hypothetical protein